MAKAKCKICGTELDTKTAYKVADKNGKNKYFCSASEFEAEENRKKKAQEDKDRVYRLICDIMGEKEIINTALFKEWQVCNWKCGRVRLWMAPYHPEYTVTALPVSESQLAQ